MGYGFMAVVVCVGGGSWVGCLLGALGMRSIHHKLGWVGLVFLWFGACGRRVVEWSSRRRGLVESSVRVFRAPRPNLPDVLIR